MSTDLIVRGDLLHVLEPISSIQAPPTSSPRALVWGADLTVAKSSRHARKRLIDHCRQAAELGATHPALAHLFVAYSLTSARSGTACLPTAARAAARAHAELERTRGRYIEVVVLDVTLCTDPAALRDRIAHAVGTPAGVAGDVALDWHDIVDCPIRAAAAAQLC